jgi:hypothetical protein
MHGRRDPNQSQSDRGRADQFLTVAASSERRDRVDRAAAGSQQRGGGGIGRGTPQAGGIGRGTSRACSRTTPVKRATREGNMP